MNLGRPEYSLPDLAVTLEIPVFEILSWELFKFDWTQTCFPSSSVGKESACSAEDPGLIPGLGRSHGEGNGNPLQYTCLENAMDREA